MSLLYLHRMREEGREKGREMEDGREKGKERKREEEEVRPVSPSCLYSGPEWTNQNRGLSFFYTLGKGKCIQLVAICYKLCL